MKPPKKVKDAIDKHPHIMINYGWNEYGCFLWCQTCGAIGFRSFPEQPSSGQANLDLPEVVKMLLQKEK